jgi:ATP-dependent Lon protease
LRIRGISFARISFRGWPNRAIAASRRATPGRPPGHSLLDASPTRRDHSHHDYANPVIVVDEVDKASGDGQYDPLGALYELLEVKTATRFVDEFVELPIDASGAVWLATANDAAQIPEPLLSRLAVYEIEAPDEAGATRIAGAIYSEMRGAHDWGRQFPESLSPAALEKFASLPPREMRRALQAAFGAAKLDGRNEVHADDIADPRARKQRIGF